MRIIRILVMLLVIWMTLIPHLTLAAEGENANETQINFKIQENIGIQNGFAYDKSIISAYALKNSKAENPEETKRDAVLAKYSAKIAKADFPQGKFAINASAYTAAADECGKSDGITASGLKVKENRTLACPPQFPLGTKIKIDGRGVYVCEDRGGAIKGNHFDIYMQTKKEAFAFGRKNLMAEVIF